MRDPADKLFLIFAIGLVALGAAMASFVIPAATGVAGAAVALVLVGVLAGRVFGAAVGVVVSFALPLAAVALLSRPLGIFSLPMPELLEIFMIAIVSAGCALYVAALGRQADQATAAQEDISAAAQLGVGLVPRSLNQQALGHLLGSVEAMVGASCVALFVLDNEGALSAVSHGRSPSCKGSLAVAELICRAAAAGEGAAGRQALSVIASTADAYLPVVSGERLEGVFFAGRGGTSRSWTERDVGIMGFAADLLGALIERERLQGKATHVAAMEEADALKANILLSISHDLRTPLAAANATVASLRDAAADRGDAETRDDLADVMDDLSVLDWRIGELIDLSRLEAASWKPNIDWNDASDLCNFVLSAAGERATSRVRCIVPSDMPPFMFDLVQLGRAVHHLVENALAYSPPDSEVELEMAYGDQEIRVLVTDCGPGLVPEEMEEVFEKFRRGSAGRTVPHGSGLGLAIASNIVAAHRGRIQVENTEPVGARFTVVLPRSQEDTQ